MGAQASTARGDGDTASDRESAASFEEVTLQHSSVQFTSTVAVSARVRESVPAPRRAIPPAATTKPATATATATPRPPVAPANKKSSVVADRVIEIRGTIKHAYPLLSLKQQDKSDSEDAFSGDFSVGTGPCGRDAAQVVAWEVQLHDSYQTCYVFLYDKWADAVSRFQRHYKVHVYGRGLVAIDHWDIGHDTEDVRRCYVVAEPLLLKRTAERSPRLLPKPEGITVEIAYEEPQRIPDSDQVKYQPEQVIHARDLYPDKKPALLTTTSKAAKPATTSLEKPNPRGKRSLREINSTEVAGAAITTPSSYVYTPLAELIPGNACVYGVVVNMSLPKRSEGHDFYMSLHLVDESRPRREDALQVMVFLPTIEQMPRILHVGDIVRFHKIRINRYQDKLQGVCNSRATRYLVLRRDKSNPQKVEQQTCSASWTFEKYDQERFAQLAKWADHALHIDTTLPPGCPQPSRLLGDMQYAESFADVVVRVLHIQEPHEDFTVARMIIWDGSGQSVSCQDLYAKLRREKEKSDKAVPFIPETGLLMEIIVDSCWIVMQTLGFLPELPAQWCRFRNLAVSAEHGEPGLDGAAAKDWFDLHFREVSSVMLVPESSSDVQIRTRPLTRRSHDQDELRLTERDDQIADSSAVAVLAEPRAAGVPDPIPHVITQVPAFITDKVPVTSLQSVLASPHVPRKYHCHARVVKLWPSKIQQLAKPKASTDGTYVYSFAMRLEDATGQIDVIVHGDDAEKFLHGIPPCDLSTSTSSRSLLQKRLQGLLARPAPLHFCVKSYKPKPTPTNQGNTDDSVRFRVFDTTLLAVP